MAANIHDLQMNPKLRDVWFKPARLKIVHGGRASSKSFDFSTAIAYIGMQLRLKVVVARQFQSSIKDSCKSLIEERIDAMGAAPDYDFQRTTTLDKVNGTEYLYYGIARNILEIKSINGVDVLIIEEAAKLTAEQWSILEPTIRKEYSEIWIIFNPDLATDFVWSLVLNPPADSIVVQINYTDNPFLSKTMIKSIADAKLRMPPEEFDHVYLGVPKTDDQRAFIKPSWLRSCVDAHIYLKRKGIAEGARRVGFDIADAGADTSAVACASGNYLEDITEWASTEDKLLESVKTAYGMALEYGGVLVPDVIGIGASAIPKVIEMNEERTRLGLSQVEYDKFHAGSRPSESTYQNDISCADHFANLKAEAWGKLADRARNTHVLVTAMKRGDEELPNFTDEQLFSINGQIPGLLKLITELSSPRKLIDDAGMVACEGKKAMFKDRGIPSPNLADAAVIAMYREDGFASFFDMI